jgi:hypothetical protein
MTDVRIDGFSEEGTLWFDSKPRETITAALEAARPKVALGSTNVEIIDTRLKTSVAWPDLQSRWKKATSQRNRRRLLSLNHSPRRHRIS